MVNRVFIIGNLGQDPEVKYTKSGTAVATLSVATSRSWKDKDGQKQEETEWHRCQAWDGTAKFAGDYLHKGSKVYIEGRLQTRKWQDKDGRDCYTTEIVVGSLQNLSPRSDGAQGPPLPPGRDEHDSQPDMPF